MNWFTNKSNTDQFLRSSLYSGLPTEADGIDLRIEMNRILYGGPASKALGHWVILRSYNRLETTPYFNPTTKEGVGGPQHTFTDTLVRTRMVKGNGATDVAFKAGDITFDQYTYYFEYTVSVKTGDQIYELDITDHTFKPTKYSFVSKYDIKRVNPYRLENGNVQYFAAIAEFSNITY